MVINMKFEFYRSPKMFYKWGYTKLPDALVIELGNYAIDIIFARTNGGAKG